VASGTARGEPIQHDKWVTGLAFSPDGKTLLTVGYNRVGIWKVETGQRLAELDHQSGYVTGATFTHDGRAILTGSSDGKARLWNVPGESRGSLSAPYRVEALAVAPNGPFFATGGENGRIDVWNAVTRQHVATYKHPGGVMALAFGQNGWLLSGGEDRTARLWDLANDRPPLVLVHQAPVNAVAFSPDGSLALTGSLDRTARVWDAVTGQARGQPLVHAGEVLAVAFGPDGRTAASTTGASEAMPGCGTWLSATRSAAR
jgi:WD40 repeat protein